MFLRLSRIAPFALALLLAPIVQRAGAQATVCKDGTTSTAAGRGACSGHNGVDEKASKAAAKVAKAQAKAAAAETKAAATQVTCTDGSMSAGGRGACSSHGGIGKSNKAERKAEKLEAKADKMEAKAGGGDVDDRNPAGAIARCKDGMYSHAKSRQGACARHGGIAS